MYVTPVRGIDNIKRRITEVIGIIPAEMVKKNISREIEYQLDILRATNGAHVEVT